MLVARYDQIALKKMKQLLILLFTLTAGLLRSQTVIDLQNIDTTPLEQLPTGWTNVGLNNSSFRCDSTNSSSGYSGASGTKNIMIRNSDPSGVYTLKSPVFNASGLTNISVIWGSRVSLNFLQSGSSTPTLYFSTDGNNWNTLNYVENDANSQWALVNNNNAIQLPASANNSAFIQFKWELNIVNNTNGTYRMDDIQITGLSPLMTNVSIQVDMSQQIVNPSGVRIQGNFQNWNPSATLMNNLGNNIYAYSGVFNVGDQIYFRVINGILSSQAEIVPDACASTYNNTNCRIYSVVPGDNNVSFCFSSCSSCVSTPISIFGCTDNLACNYNAAANVADNSCLYAGQSCDDNSALTTNDQVNPECWCTGDILGGGCSEVFISEYVEGLGNNRAIELYNPTNNNIDLSNYGLVRYSNGSDVAGNVSYLTGATIDAHSTYVIALDKRDSLGTGLEAPIFPELQMVADTFLNPLSSGGTWPMYFSGNDAVALVKTINAVDNQVDLFGKIGEGAGFGGWNAYGTNIIGQTLYISENHTLQRKYTVTQGIPINPASFDITIEYDSLPNNTFSGLGVHDCQCNIVPVPGCNNLNACNFDPNANQYDGSCLFVNAPCNDQLSSTVNDAINTNCECVGIIYIPGCTDNIACNYNPNATVEDASCLYTGNSCNDNNASTFQDAVNASCICSGIEIFEGCTNVAACNFDSNANLDDGSCLVIGMPCMDGNPQTVSDIVGDSCTCSGTLVSICPGLTTNFLINQITCNHLASIQTTASSIYAPISFEWSNGATTPNVQNLNSGPLTLIITDSTGCQSNYLFTIDNFLGTPLQIVLDSIVHNNCFGYHDGLISIHALGGSGLFNLIWDTDPISTSITISNLAAGNYTAHVTDTEGCETYQTYTIEEPAGQYPQITGPAVVDNLSPAIYNISNPGNYSYSWNVDGGIITNQNNGMLFVQWGSNTFGHVTLTQVDSSGCSVQTTFSVQVGTEIQENVLSETMVFPNPTFGFLEISSPFSFNQIDLFSIDGKRIFSQFFSHEIDLSELPSGLYVLKLTGLGKQEVFKIHKL